MNTLLLDRTLWDWVVDSQGNLAVASDPYSLAQDASSVVRTFKGECLYDQRLGLPYLSNWLGRAPSRSLVAARVVKAVEAVPGVVKVRGVALTLDATRRFTGSLELATSAGATFTVGL